MSHITDYETIKTLDATNLFLLDGNTGTKTILAPDLAKSLQSLLTTKERLHGINLRTLNEVNLGHGIYLAVMDSDGEMRVHVINSRSLYDLADIPSEDGRICAKKSLFRGRSLGNSVTDEQWEEIRKGTFKDMYIGDFWTIGATNYYIVDFDYWIGRDGSTNSDCYKRHHVMILPLDPSGICGEVVMNDTPSTSGAFLGSKIYRETIPNQVLPVIRAAFGENHLLTHTGIYCNSIDADGSEIGVIWKEETITIPNEFMIFGCRNFSSRFKSTGTVDVTDSKQLSYFTLQSRYTSRITFWLRDVSDNLRFTIHGNVNQTSRKPANEKAYIVPVFAIGVK